MPGSVIGVPARGNAAAAGRTSMRLFLTALAVPVPGSVIVPACALAWGCKDRSAPQQNDVHRPIIIARRERHMGNLIAAVMASPRLPLSRVEEYHARGVCPSEMCNMASGFIGSTRSSGSPLSHVTATNTNRNRNRMRKSIIFLMNCLMIAAMPNACSAMADNTIQIFGVAVYVDHAPQCTLGTAIPIKASVSPFKAQVDLGDLVTELARQGAEVGGKLIYAIELDSFIPYQGANATAIASTCLNANFLPFSSSLIDIMSRATSVRGFLFNVGVPGAVRSVSASKPSLQPLKADSTIDKLRNLILSHATYDLTSSLRKSCPFLPSFGFEMTAKDSTAWWLISESCQTAELVSPDTDWSRSDVANLSAGGLPQFRSLFASGGTK